MLSEEGMHFHTDTSWTRQVEAVDLALLTRFNRIEHPVLHRLMIGFTKLGDTSSWVILGVTLLVMGGSAALFGQRLAVSALSAAAIAQVLKRIAKRTRPSHAHPTVRERCVVPACSSFPSGHTLTAFAVAMAMGGLDSWTGSVGLLFAMGVGCSRVYLGAHYPGDVTVGAILGSVWGTALLFLGGPVQL